MDIPTYVWVPDTEKWEVFDPREARYIWITVEKQCGGRWVRTDIDDEKKVG